MYSYVKRYIDFILSVLGLIILSPLFIIIAIIIKVESPGPVFFKQERVGLKKKPFRIYKFRTMKTEAPPNSPTWKLNNSEKYITTFGKYIRRLSIDELPQLINIIKGEMSFIGPRPVVLNEIELIFERGKKNVFTVLPGLTGLAQINGRDNLDFMTKAQFDKVYVENISFLYDFKIFILTITYILRMDGIVEGMIQPINKNEKNLNE